MRSKLDRGLITKCWEGVIGGIVGYYKMVPNMGIELNGLFFPRRSPLPLDFFLPYIPIGFSQVPKKGGDRFG